MDDISKRGLSREEARKRLAEAGYNELQEGRKRGLADIAFEVVREPMFLLLVAAGSIYLVLGDMQEALTLIGFVFVVMGITIYQENKTERALESLRDLTSPRALVLRDGSEERIAGREVVPGDVLILSEGDRVSADAMIIECNDLSVDESLLTGESVPVQKRPAAENEEICPPGGENIPFVYAGTLVTQGKGIALVLHTGKMSEIGKIGLALEVLQTERTPLQGEIARLVKNLALAGLLLSFLLAAVYAYTRGSWLGGLLAAITMAMAILPEEFPVVLTVFLALGAWRIAKNRVLTRRLPAVETLGSATVLCVDKTGTLTENRMSVAALAVANEAIMIENAPEHLPESFHSLLEYGILASETDPFDPMEKAFHALGLRYLSDSEHLHPDLELVHEYSLSPLLPAMTHVWGGKGKYRVACKGAPEALFELCRLKEKKHWEAEVERMASDGLRVLAVARAEFEGGRWPESQQGFDFEFIGLVGLVDPVRASVPAALAECIEAGIRVVMITGDNPLTALAVARRIGLDPGKGPLTGSRLAQMSDEELGEKIRQINLFARVAPGQKLRLVQALRRDGEIVAMTGDGVNDAPALKAAHIGVAMGKRGTDVARESASLVLLDDDFASIVHAVRLGRRIYANLSKAFAYSLSVHVPITGMSLIPLFMGWPLLFFPVHIAFLQLIIDPVCSLVFEAEPEDKKLMREPPRPGGKRLFDARTVRVSLMQGTAVLLIMLAVYSHYLGEGEAYARTLAFSTLVFANLGLIFVNRSWSEAWVFGRPNPLLWWVVAGAILSLALVLTSPALYGLFGFAEVKRPDLWVAVAAGIVSVSWFEIFKAMRGNAA